MDELTDTERLLLTFEGQWWRTGREKRQAIQALFSCSPAVYGVRLRRLVDRPAALAYDPLLVRRLRRRHAAQADAPAARLGGG